jgi:ferredoxin--NADP+ reductase
MELDALSREDLDAGVGGPNAKNNVQILKEQSLKPSGGKPRRIVIRFLVSPVELIGRDGKVSQIRIEHNALERGADGRLAPKGTGKSETLPVGLVLRSVGYKGVALPGLPFDEKKGTLPNVQGRIADPKTRQIFPGLYVVGWAKRGPSGVIGTNKPDSIETVNQLFADYEGKPLSALPGGPVEELLRAKKVSFVDYSGWKILDELELEMGKAKGKVRDKFFEIEKMIAEVRRRGGASA